MGMNLGIVITLVILAFGAGGFFARIEYRLNRLEEKLNKMDGKFIPLVTIHQLEIVKYYVERGILPNPGMSPRKQYLLDRINSHTISLAELQELNDMLDKEKQEAERVGNKDAWVAIMGLLALVAVLIILAKK